MSEINLPPFYVGQKVVAVVGTERLKKGSEHIVKATYFKDCCKRWYVCVGIKDKEAVPVCPIHNTKHKLPMKAVFHNERYFRSVDENFQYISLEKVLEKETHLISVN